MSAQSWQLYDPQGRPLANRRAGKYEVVVNGLLHGSAHVWIWRREGQKLRVLVQQRATRKIYWPGMIDKSAGGHSFLGEDPLATALRKLKQEIGVTAAADQLQLIGTHHWRAVLDDMGLVDNE